MTGSGIESIQIIVLLLLVFVVVFAILARRLQTPYPILLVLGGLALSLIPAVPAVPLESDLIFFVVLPPLVIGRLKVWTVRHPEPPFDSPSLRSGSLRAGSDGGGSQNSLMTTGRGALSSQFSHFETLRRVPSAQDAHTA